MSASTRFRAQVHYMIPLADPLATGNGGLEGFDEEGRHRVFPNKGLAVGWLTGEFRKHRPPSKLGWASDGNIEREVYDRQYDDWFADHRFFYESPFMYADPPGDTAVPSGEERVA